MRLIFEWDWAIPYEAQGTETYAVEYSGKEDFQMYVLEKIEEAKKQDFYYVNILGRDMILEDVEKCIMTGVYTLDEWFEKNKISVV